MSRIKRKEDVFFSMFREFSLMTVECSRVFEDVVHHYPASNGRVPELKEYELKCDAQVSRMLTTLNQSFITPFDREDISLLTKAMDEVTDGMEGVGSRFALYDVREMREDAVKMCDLIIQAVASLDKAFTDFENYKRDPEVQVALIETNDIEDQGDAVYRDSLAKLFHELANEPVECLKWKSLMDSLEGILDHCEGVSNIMLNVILKNA